MANRMHFALQKSQHTCRGTDCRDETKGDFLFCPWCWSLVTQDNRDRLMQSLKRDRHSQAAHEAIQDCINDISEYQEQRNKGWRP